MILLNPHAHRRPYRDQASRQMMLRTIDFFENKGLAKIKEDDRQRKWYADFIEFQKDERLFARLLTPTAEGAGDTRWDTWRNCEFNEILGFYGLAYWYTWQVSILGLGPVWMSSNEGLRQRAARLLEEGNVFALGLSERRHGADIYSTEMTLTPRGDGSYLANGEKYYIGNANAAPLVSTFGKLAPEGDYVFFAADYRRPHYELLANVTDSQNYVAQFALHDYPVDEGEILSLGQPAWDTALNTVNIGKFNLGWASIGICTHALYESINHAANRRLYGMYVTDFPHVRRMLIEAYCRLVSMKLFALRAADYQRAASADDRRYLLYNPVVKMKVTTQGEQVINLLWDVIAARGFEKDTYFEMAARDIRALPKLEGTVHVNIALIVKFMANYFFNPGDYPAVEQQDQPEDDTFIFNQGPARGLSRITFHNYREIFQQFDLPNVAIFFEQSQKFAELLAGATPDEQQRQDIDFLMGLGELFTLIVYGQLILENARIYGVDEALVEEIFSIFVADFSAAAISLHNKPSSTGEQMDYCRQMLRKPAVDPGRTQRIWEEVHALNGVYVMKA